MTATIEDQAQSVLQSAIEHELSKKVKDRDTLFEVLSITVNSCTNRMKTILGYLQREPISPAEGKKEYIRISEMYDELENAAHNLPKPAVPMTEIAPRGFKRTAFGIYRTQDEILNAQQTHLIAYPVDDVDKKILAEALYLKKVYKQTEKENTILCLCSTDHHFSPMRRKSWRGLESRGITDEIKSRFDIICDWPKNIMHFLQKAGIR